MTNLDKKIICLVLIFTMMIGFWIPIAYATGNNGEEVVYTNPDPALKTNTEPAKLYYNHVLTASGDLYTVDRSNLLSSMKKIDSNVSKLIYSNYTLYLYYLRNNNTLVVSHSNGNTVKIINNVKDFGSAVGYMFYVNTNNELYKLNNQLNEEKIEIGVNKLIGSSVYIKDGKTYSLNGIELLDVEIDKAYWFNTYVTFLQKGTKLYRLDYFEPDVYLITDKFSKFEYGNFQEPINIICTDGSKNKIEDLIYNLNFSSSYLTLNGNTVMDGSKKVMTNISKGVNVEGFNSCYLFLRTDGSAWVVLKDGTTACVLENTKKIIPFSDVKTTSWYYNAVSYVYFNNIIKGYNEKTFAPNDKMSRGMFVTILYRMEGEPKISGAPKFSDVQDSSKYYYKAIKWATDNGIVSGYENGKFGPNDNITREQFAVILYKYARYKNKNTSATNNLSKFSDGNNVSNWAVSQVKWAVGAGVITGNDNGTLNAKAFATRAEGAAMIEKYCKKIGR